MSVHLDRGYDSKATRELLEERGLLAEISQKGKPAPLAATKRWVVENAPWWNAPIRGTKRPQGEARVWCTERQGAGEIDFWVAFSEVIFIVRRLIRAAWVRYRWKTRTSRRP